MKAAIVFLILTPNHYDPVFSKFTRGSTDSKKDRSVQMLRF